MTNLTPTIDVSEIITNRVNNFLSEFYQQCISSLTSDANNLLVSRKITLDMRDYIFAHLGQRPDSPEHPVDWVTPAFDNAHDYCHALRSEGQAVIPFGKYNDNFMKLYAIGRVECWDMDSDLFRNEGILTVSYSQRSFEHIRIIVLGSIAGTGTEVLLDINRNLWFYNPENAVDPYVLGTKPQQAAIILKVGSRMDKTTPWDIIEIFEDAEIVFDPSSELSEEDS